MNKTLIGSIIGAVALIALVITVSLAGNNSKAQKPMMSETQKNETHQTGETMKMPEKIQKTESEWKNILSEEVFRVTRKKGTERAFSGKYNDFKEKGTFTCSNCGLPLFSSEHKFNSGTGWPSFHQTIKPEHVTETSDLSLGMLRTEVLCSRCDAHLGHVFNDGPAPTGRRYCINSVSLDFKPSDDE